MRASFQAIPLHTAILRNIPFLSPLIKTLIFIFSNLFNFLNSGSVKFIYCLLKPLSPFWSRALYVQQTTRQDEGAVIAVSLPSN